VEGAQFDALSRRLGKLRSRRGALKVIGGALAAAIAGTGNAHAQSCRAHYSPCTGDQQCCPGSVCQYGLCMPGCRIDGTFTTAWGSSPDNICGQCQPELSTSAWTPVNEGMSCWSGDPTAGATFCQGGECRMTGPAQCPPPPPCHTDQLIDPATCTYAVAEEGTACGGQAMCHGGFAQPVDTCDGNGFCIGGGSRVVACAPYRCGVDACETACTTNGDCVGGASCCGGVCVTLGSDDHCAFCGDACDGDSVCCNGACTELGTDDHCAACNDDCASGSLCCGGACTALGTDTNCASCGDVCLDGQSCVDGTCAAICLPLVARCDSADQCCQNEPTECFWALGNNGIDVCCHPLGGSCSSGMDCCFWAYGPGTTVAVACSPQGVCGGQGASCQKNYPETCQSGICCGGTGPAGTCCGVGQTCSNGTCI